MNHEPLTADDKRTLLGEILTADAAELLVEYEHLLPERFTRSPDGRVAPKQAIVAKDTEGRLKEPHAKIFNSK